MGPLLVQKGYGSVTLPNALLEQVDEFLADNKWGFTTRPEVAKVAIRDFLMRHQERVEAEEAIRGKPPK